VEFTSNRIIVVGAGVAGLAAGQQLLQAGLAPIVLEARDRIGGRILTVHDSGSPFPVELGAEFVHGRHPALWKVLLDSGAPLEQVAGDGNWDEMDGIFDQMAKAPEQSFADFIAKVDAPEYVKQAATGFVEGFNAACKERVSVEWLNRENAASDEIEGDRSFRVRSGYDSVPAFLGKNLDIRLNTAVRRLSWQRGAVVAETDAGEFRASKAIVAVPVAVLLERALIVDPEPQTLSRARAAIGVGNAIRVTFRFRDPVPEIGFLHGDRPFPVCWTDGPVVTAWAAGPKADALSGLTPEQLKQTALSSLRAILEKDPGEPEGAWLHGWRADPWSLAAYSFVRVGGLAVQQQLCEPVDDTLYFAGEAVAPSGHVGTVHGAIVSGIHAATSVMSERTL
jgi:monoamine oxidase